MFPIGFEISVAHAVVIKEKHAVVIKEKVAENPEGLAKQIFGENSNREEYRVHIQEEMFGFLTTARGIASIFPDIYSLISFLYNLKNESAGDAPWIELILQQLECEELMKFIAESLWNFQTR